MTNTPPIPPSMPHPSRPAPDEARVRWQLSGGWGRLITVIMMAIFAFVLMCVVGFMVYRDHQYRTDGKEVQGVIQDKRISVSRNSKGRESKTYYIRYSFTDGAGRLIEDEDSESSQAYNAVREGQPHPVEYLQSDSSIHRLKLPRSSLAEWIMSGIALLLAIGSFWIFKYTRNTSRRRAAVLFHGQRQPGQIVVSEQRGRGKNRRSVLAYRYVDLAGREQVSKEMTVGAKVMNRFPVGTLVTVTIDPNDPTRPEPDLYGVYPVPSPQISQAASR